MHSARIAMHQEKSPKRKTADNYLPKGSVEYYRANIMEKMLSNTSKLLLISLLELVWHFELQLFFVCLCEVSKTNYERAGGGGWTGRVVEAQKEELEELKISRAQNRITI